MLWELTVQATDVTVISQRALQGQEQGKVEIVVRIRRTGQGRGQVEVKVKVKIGVRIQVQIRVRIPVRFGSRHGLAPGFGSDEWQC